MAVRHHSKFGWLIDVQKLALYTRQSSVTHKSAITDHAVEENHVEKSGRQGRTTTNQVKELLWIRKTQDMNMHEPTHPHTFAK